MCCAGRKTARITFITEWFAQEQVRNRTHSPVVREQSSVPGAPLCSSSPGPPQEHGFRRTTSTLKGRDEPLKAPEEAFHLYSNRFPSVLLLQLGSQVPP